MNSLNSILLEGNLVRDPMSKVLPSGMPVCDFVVATNRTFRQNDVFEKETSFFDVEAWSKLGASCASNLAKGRGVRVVGRLKQDRWFDGEGKQRSRVKIVAEHVEFKPVKAQSTEVAEFEAQKSGIDVSQRNSSISTLAYRGPGSSQGEDSAELKELDEAVF